MNAPMTDPQRDFIAALRHQTRCPDYALDNWSIWTYGVRVDGLDIRQASALIEEMKEWKQLPARLQRAMGQRDLPGLDATDATAAGGNRSLNQRNNDNHDQQERETTS